MGVYDRGLITTTDVSQRVASITAYLNNLNPEPANPIISAETVTESLISNTYIGTAFSFPGTEISGFFGYWTSDVTRSTTYLKKGNTYLISPVNRAYTQYNEVVINSYVDSRCLYIAINDLNQNHAGIELVKLLTSDSKVLLGYKELATIAAEVTNEVADISALVFENLADTSRIPHTYTNMFPYVATAGTIDFTNEAFFVNGGVKAFSTDTLKECSTVALLSTQSLPTGNCVALGAHCLAPLDDE